MSKSLKSLIARTNRVAGVSSQPARKRVKLSGPVGGSAAAKVEEASSKSAQARVEEGSGSGGSSLLRLDEYCVSFTNAAGDEPRSMTAGAAGFTTARSLTKDTKKSLPKGSTRGAVKAEQMAPASAEGVSDEGATRVRLDSTQAEIAAMDIERPLLIVAGAGSGKTATLCARVVEMMRRGVAGAQIMVMTFTKKAADELRERIDSSMRAEGLAGKTPYASTFHAWCYRLVLQNYGVLGWTSCPLVVAAESEHRAVCVAAMQQIESTRKLRQCEALLGISVVESAEERELLWVADLHGRWVQVAEVARNKLGVDASATESGEKGPKKGKGGKASRVVPSSEAEHALATDVLYARVHGALGAAANAVDLSSEPIAFGCEFGAGKDVVRSVLQFVYRAKSRGLAGAGPTGPLATAVLAAYNGVLRQHGLVDFDDLLELAARILDDAVVLANVRRTWAYLLVDEFQDLNAQQMALVLRLQSGVGRVTAVGDERQSIFAFRGAQCESNFGAFLRAFVDASVGCVGAMRTLTRNYRSHQSIVDLGNIVARDTAGASPLLARLRVPLAALESAPVVPVCVWSSESADREARRIAERIATLLRSGDCRASDVAIVSRVLRFGQYRPTAMIERELVRQGIAYVVRGGSSSLRSQRAQALLALARLTANPADSFAADTCLQMLVPGIGPALATRVRSVGATRIDPPEALAQMEMAARTPGLLTRPARESLSVFAAHVRCWNAALTAGNSPPLETLVETMYNEYVRAAEDTADDREAEASGGLGAADQLWLMVQAVVKSVVSTDAPGQAEGVSAAFLPGDLVAPCSPQLLAAFVAQMCMLSSSAEDRGRITRPKGLTQDTDDDAPPDAVVITTVHQAKGLEWEHVFIPHFIENLFPMGFRDDTAGVPALAGPKKPQSSAATVTAPESEAPLSPMDQHYREEGRLAYVAITRARRGLYISTLAAYPLHWMEKVFNASCQPSRYLPAIVYPRKKAAHEAAAMAGGGGGGSWRPGYSGFNSRPSTAMEGFGDDDEGDAYYARKYGR
ncbi:hypothetical protein GGI07_005411 [Coemansia sp. Benny D115]|nr:hypothetical protein GGI07_005411 [Coemansia sp. Benny D115]